MGGHDTTAMAKMILPIEVPSTATSRMAACTESHERTTMLANAPTRAAITSGISISTLRSFGGFLPVGIFERSMRLF